MRNPERVNGRINFFSLLRLGISKTLGPFKNGGETREKSVHYFKLLITISLCPHIIRI